MSAMATCDLTTVESLKTWLAGWLADELAVDASTIRTNEPFLSFGMNSVQAMTMVGDLEAKLDLRLPPTLAWDYGDIDALADHLQERLAEVTPAISTSAAPARLRPNASHADAASLLAELDMISDDDVDRLLGEYLGASK